jgi:hypothetical protein
MNEVDRRKCHSPRHPLPRGSGADKRDHGTAGPTGAARYQLKCRVCNDYSSVPAQSRDLVCLAGVTQPAPLHRPVEPVPMQTLQYRWNDDVEASAQRLVRRITCNLGYPVVPLPDDPVPINRDSRPLLLTRPLQSVHNLNTACIGYGFTQKTT